MHETPLQRALAVAPERAAPEVARPDEEYFLVRCGDLLLGVRSEHVREVTRLGPLTPLPRAPAFLLGVVGHRGQVVPLVDLLRFLQLGEARLRVGGRLFVSELGGQVVGFLADQVIGLWRVDAAARLPAPVGAGGQAEYVRGVVQHEHLGALTLLDLPRIIHAARQRVVAR